jgi:GNAT superfamily N-acetyltransferase
VIRARAGTEADHATFVRLHAELGVDDIPPDPAAFATDIVPGMIVLEDEGQVAAYGFLRVYGVTGHVMHVVVDPAWRGRGVGRRLMTEAAAWLRARGCTSWRLNVKVGNTPAITLYESVGMTITGRTTGVRLPWELVSRLPAGDVLPREVDPGEHALLERTFGLAAGQLAVFSKDPLAVMRCLDGAAGLVRFAVTRAALFVYATEPEQLRPLLESVRPFADRPHVSISAEDELARRLVEVGAEVRLEIHRMEGPLPP